MATKHTNSIHFAENLSHKNTNEETVIVTNCVK